MKYRIKVHNAADHETTGNNLLDQGVTLDRTVGQNARRRPGWMGLGFFGIIVALAVGSLVATVRFSAQLAEGLDAEPARTLVKILIRGNEQHVDQHLLPSLFPQAQETLSNARTQTREAIHREIDLRMSQAFVPVIKRVPHFADWFYSLQGEYSRYAAALTGNVVGFLKNQMTQRVFASAHFSERLEKNLRALDQHLVADLQATSDTLKNDLLTAIMPHTIPVDDTPSRQVEMGETLDLDEIFVDTLAVTEAGISRQVLNGLTATGVGVLTAKGMGAVVAKNAAAKFAGTKTFQAAAALLAKLAAKASVKGGGSLGAAATGLAFCSPGGFVALVCGAAAGVATWITVDKVFIEFDEAINRHAFERDLRQAILAEHERLKAQLKDTYGKVIDEQYAQIAHRLEQGLKMPTSTLVPADTLPR